MDEDSLEQARAKWRHRGQRRPTFAVEPGPGQESVWDYPRPPALVSDPREVIVRASDVELAHSDRCYRVLETASPPTFYIPPEDVKSECLVPVPGTSFCEWKGQAQYFDIVVSEKECWRRQAWSYAHPMEGFKAIAGYFCFYPNGLECFVGGEPVQAQPGHFYGGWITADVVGPFKGEAGTGDW